MSTRDAQDYWNRYVVASPEDLESRFLDSATDPCTLIVKTVVAGGRAVGAVRAGMTAEEIATFLESSFGAFQQELRNGRWSWSHDDLVRAVDHLAAHGLIEAHDDRRYELTPLGRLAGESGTEVVSIIRLVECLRPLRPEHITDPALITAVQVTQELSQVYVPLNKKTPKEAQSWSAELARQGVPHHVLRCLARDVNDQHEEAERLKRAVAALAYVSGEEIGAIERLLARHGGGFDGSAGPVRSIASRTCDLLGTAARVAELVHPELQLGERVERLNLRLTLGITGVAVDLARYAGGDLTRGDYRRLTAAGLSDCDNILNAEDDALLSCVGGDEGRLAVLRTATEKYARARAAAEGAAAPPSLAPYAA